MPASWQSPDLDEFRADQFVVNNEKVRPFLRGEGEREGMFFHLRSTRREGWIARVRAAGYNVRTLQDRIDALPTITPDVVVGDMGVRPLGSAREHVAAWDRERLNWHDLPVETINGVRGVRLHVNEPLRRRKSRSGGDFFIAIAEGTGRIGLRPTSANHAILHAYSLMAASERPALMRYTATPEGHMIPAEQALLPERHREMLDRLALDGRPRWTFDREHTDLAEQVFDRLGIVFEPAP